MLSLFLIKLRPFLLPLWRSNPLSRKHLGRDPHSLYRAVAECLFKSQRFYPDVKNDVEQFLLTHNNNNNNDGDDDDGDGDVSMHRAAKAVAKIYEVDIEIVSAADSHCVPVIITPESDDEPAGSCGVCDEDDSRWVALFPSGVKNVQMSSCLWSPTNQQICVGD